MDFVQDYFTPEEISICRLEKGPGVFAANLIWSAKESTLKALRQGLRRDTRSVQIHPDFSMRENTWSAWTGRCLESSRIFYGWWRSCEGYVYTLVSDRITSEPIQLQKVEPSVAAELPAGGTLFQQGRRQ
jgi:hypothetical protein